MEIVIIAGILLWLILAIVYIVRHRNQGCNSCTGFCSGCMQNESCHKTGGK